MASRKRIRPVADHIESQREPAETAVAVEELPTAQEIVAQVVEAQRMPEERQPGEDVEFKPRPDTSGRYPNRESLPEHDLLHTFDPTPERGMVTHHVNGGWRHGGTSVEMTDYGHTVGAKIRTHDGSKPEPEMLLPLKGERKYGESVTRGLSWDGRAKEWGKRVPEGAGVALRLETEGRVADSAKIADRILEERAKAGDQDRSPF